MSDFDKLDEKTETELQAAAFRRLRDHFQNRTDVQNIDMMTLAGFAEIVFPAGFRMPPGKRAWIYPKKKHVPIFTGCPILNGANAIKLKQLAPRKRPLIKHININKTGLSGGITDRYWI